MTLEKLTDDADSFTFFACRLRSFFAISLFSIIVILSAIVDYGLAYYFESFKLTFLQKCQRK